MSAEEKAKLVLTLKEMFHDVSIGLGGYLAGIELEFIRESNHIIIGVFTAVLCCAAVHYAKKLLKLIDNLAAMGRDKVVNYFKSKK
jgi:ammonia channel protein AmtB